MKKTFFILIVVLLFSSCQTSKYYFNYRKGGSMMNIENTEQIMEIHFNSKFVNPPKLETLSNEDSHQIVKTKISQPSEPLITTPQKSLITGQSEKPNLSKTKDDKTQNEEKGNQKIKAKRITAYLAYFGIAKVLSLITGISYAASLWITFGAVIFILLLYFLLLWIALCYM